MIRDGSVAGNPPAPHIVDHRERRLARVAARWSCVMSTYPPPPGSPQSPYPPAPDPQTPQYGPPPRQKGRKGCLVAIIIVLVLLVVTIAAVVAGAIWLGNKAQDAIGSSEPCPYITNEEASAALGTEAEATLFTGLGRVLNITDMRVLPDHDSCILQGTSSSSGSQDTTGLGRAVKYVGPDARMLYEREVAKAKGTSQESGQGLAVETQPYFAKDVSGLGERAFCTTSSGTLAGVLVLDGDRLVYVAVNGAGTSPGAADPACEASQVLARAILDKG
jgi:hypothetical protein